MISGLSFGFAGSLHCIGMCGPLSLALPGQGLPGRKRSLALLLYNLGRVTTYTLLGILLSLVGRGFYLVGWQQQFSVMAGIVVLLLVIFYIAGKRHYRISLLNGFYQFILQQTSAFIGKIKNPAGCYLFGLLNGLLPCGMVYIAIAATLSLSSTAGSAFFMFMFGLGTLPAMLVFNLTTTSIGVKNLPLFRRMAPFFVGLAALLLILRGLNLDIPFLSPGQPSKHVEALHCKQ